MTMYFDSFLWSWSTTPYIPKFWSFWFHQLFGSTRWLAHQIPAPARATGTNAGTKNTKGWRCLSMTDFSEVIENLWKPDGKIKKKARNQIQESKKLPWFNRSLERSWDKMDGSIEYGWLHRHILDHTPPPLMRSLSHSHLKVPIIKRWKHLEANMRLVSQVIFF